MAKWSSALRKGTKAADGGAADEIAGAAVGNAAVAEEAEGAEGAAATASEGKSAAGGEDHPYDFRVCGPRNLSSPTWKDIFISSWKDPKYKRMAIACFIQGVYLMELDRQQKQAAPPSTTTAPPIDDGGLAPRWWRPFKYKLVRTLVDDRDGSIYGAVLEWDRAAALSDLVLLRPAAAPRAVLALRGTLLSGATIRRDLEDDFRFLAWESLKGSVRFAGALTAAAAMAELHGGAAVCVAGHSLGAGFALQIGKALAKKGVFVECHLFNPPSISLAAGVKSLGDRALAAWHRLRAAASAGEDDEPPPSPTANTAGSHRWAPHLYVNNSDYLCCYYCTDEPLAGGASAATGDAAAKLFVAAAKAPQRFLEAHALQQWWSDDVELRLVSGHRSKLIRRQLKSLYSSPCKSSQ